MKFNKPICSAKIKIAFKEGIEDIEPAYLNIRFPDVKEISEFENIFNNFIKDVSINGMFLARKVKSSKNIFKKKTELELQLDIKINAEDYFSPELKRIRINGTPYQSKNGMHDMNQIEKDFLERLEISVSDVSFIYSKKEDWNFKNHCIMFFI